MRPTGVGSRNLFCVLRGGRLANPHSFQGFGQKSFCLY